MTHDDMLVEEEDRRVVDALRTVGVEVNGIWDLVNTGDSYPEAIPVLIALLPEVTQQPIQEGIVRSLTVREARGVAARPLLDEFYQAPDDSSLKSAIGNALKYVVEKEHVPELLQIVQKKSHGISRQEIVAGLGRFRGNPRVVRTLIRLLRDDGIHGVAAHALEALRRLKAVEAREAVAPLVEHPRALIRREAAKTLKVLDAQRK